MSWTCDSETGRGREEQARQAMTGGRMAATRSDGITAEYSNSRMRHQVQRSTGSQADQLEQVALIYLNTPRATVFDKAVRKQRAVRGVRQRMAECAARRAAEAA